MDFNLKQWRNQQQESENQESTTHPGKLPRLLLNFDSVSDSDSAASACALPLFVSEPTPTLTKLLSDSTTTATKFPRMGSSYFSLAQWQELELQALIFRHIIAGAPVPPELLHLVNKSIISTSPPSYYFSHPFQQYPHYQQALIQSGYWGRGAMDPEPGRCRRTDGKKWRCSRDVVAGQKYCERHVHRGRSRSRKPVEIPTPVINGAKNNTTVSNQAYAKMAAHAAAPRFSLSGHPPSIDDALHLNQRPSESKKGPPLEAQKDVSGNGNSSSGQILLHFFDDWPRQQQLQEGDNATSSVASATSLSISMPSNPSSDFSLKLSTGNDYDFGPQVSNVERSTWGMSHQVSSMGGPLAEALRSSTTNSSPTSVLQQLARGSMSEASYIST